MNLNNGTFVIAFILGIAAAFYGEYVACAAVVAWGAALYWFHEIATDTKGVDFANQALGVLGTILTVYFGVLTGTWGFGAMMAASAITACVMRLAYLRQVA